MKRGMNDSSNSGISPVYLLSKDLPEDPRVDNYELYSDLQSYREGRPLRGPKNRRSLAHLYANTTSPRHYTGQWPSNERQNSSRSRPVPFMIRGSDGEEIPGTKLIISEIPISFSNTALEAALIKKKALSSDRGLKWRKCETEKEN